MNDSVRHIYVLAIASPVELVNLTVLYTFSFYLYCVLSILCTLQGYSQQVSKASSVGEFTCRTNTHGNLCLSIHFIEDSPFQVYFINSYTRTKFIHEELSNNSETGYEKNSVDFTELYTKHTCRNSESKNRFYRTLQ